MLGLIIASTVLLSSPKAEEQVIWESVDSKSTFSFKGYQRFMINTAFLNKQTQASIITSLKKRGKVNLITNFNSSALEGISQQQMIFHIAKTQTSDPNIVLLMSFASTSQKDKINGSTYPSKVWEKLYLISHESEHEIEKLADQILDEFLNELSGDLEFYILDPKKEFTSVSQKK